MNFAGFDPGANVLDSSPHLWIQDFFVHVQW